MLPQTIYDLLPVSYVTAGAVILATIEHPLAFMSGVLFTCCGIAVFKMRIK